jgi:hypothetical protein
MARRAAFGPTEPRAAGPSLPSGAIISCGSGSAGQSGVAIIVRAGVVGLFPWHDAGTRRAVIIEPGQCQLIRCLSFCGLEVAGSVGVHRAALPTAAWPRIWPGSLHRAGTVSRMRGNAGVTSADRHHDQADAHELLR